MLDFKGIPISNERQCLYVQDDTIRYGRIKQVLTETVMVEPRDLTEWIVRNPKQVILL